MTLRSNRVLVRRDDGTRLGFVRTRAAMGVAYPLLPVSSGGQGKRDLPNCGTSVWSRSCGPHGWASGGNRGGLAVHRLSLTPCQPLTSNARDFLGYSAHQAHNPNEPRLVWTRTHGGVTGKSSDRLPMSIPWPRIKIVFCCCIRGDSRAPSLVLPRTDQMQPVRALLPGPSITARHPCVWVHSSIRGRP